MNDSNQYVIHLPIFEGPLDLLLHLIEQEELDITRVSLAQVTDQYLAYLSRLEELNPANLADFLMVAAKLLLIKSRVLLPQPSALEETEEEGDPGEELVRQLLEYRKFKAVAGTLRRWEEEGRRAYARTAPPPPGRRTISLEGVSLDDLVEVFRSALQAQPLQPVDEVVSAIEISVNDKMAQIQELVAQHHELSFQHLLAASASRLEVIVTFLAILELIKQLKVLVHQEHPFGEIFIRARVSTTARNKNTL
ncbi:MAG: segregation and condensation protein A [Anaerolineae bacterium]